MRRALLPEVRRGTVPVTVLDALAGAYDGGYAAARDLFRSAAEWRRRADEALAAHDRFQAGLYRSHARVDEKVAVLLQDCARLCLCIDTRPVTCRHERADDVERAPLLARRVIVVVTVRVGRLVRHLGGTLAVQLVLRSPIRT
jgi:hypothetical protein